MDRDKMLELLCQRRALNAHKWRLNDLVKQASNNRAHHQACPLGGVFTGMGGNISGSPCWCGASDVPQEEQIFKLRYEAADAGDMAQVQICDMAIGGDVEAIAECTRVIAAAKAMVG